MTMILKLKSVCKTILENPNECKWFEELQKLIIDSPKTTIQTAKLFILVTFYPYMKTLAKDPSCFNTKEKQLLVDTLKCLLDKSTVDNPVIFFNFYSFLLFQIYDYKGNSVLPINEEYKLSILQCLTSLVSSIPSDLVTGIYSKTNVTKFSAMVFVCDQIAKLEKSRELRYSAIKCIMAFGKVSDEDDLSDDVLRYEVAKIFSFFLPGLSTTFSNIATKDPKEVHKIPMEAIKAFGRIVSLVMHDYNAADSKLDIKNFRPITKDGEVFKYIKPKYKSKEDLIQCTRTPEWYKETDANLSIMFVKLAKLVNNNNSKIKLELAEMARLVIESCTSTIPKSVGQLVDILIVLSEDESFEIANKSKDLLMLLSNKLSQRNLPDLFEYIEEGFHNAINILPRIFNSVDDAEKISAINLLIGYINLFGKYNITEVLLSSTVLNHLVETLLNISQLSKKPVSLLEECTIRNLDIEQNVRSFWTSFENFRDQNVQIKLEELCSLLSQCGALRLLSDHLLDVLIYNIEYKKEAIFLLNGLITYPYDKSPGDIEILENILNSYTDSSNWDLPIFMPHDQECTLAEIQDNIIYICLLTEGVGKIAMAMEDRFGRLLYKMLFLILERAGSTQPLIQTVGLQALSNISSACGHRDISDLVKCNMDYFLFQVERKLTRSKNNTSVFNVLGVVLKLSDLPALQSIGQIIEKVLEQYCDEFDSKYSILLLNFLKQFIENLYRWLNIEIKPFKVISKKEKKVKHFQVSGISEEITNFTDDVMKDQTAEEMFQEDLEKKESGEATENTGYQKPEPPLHIKLCVAIITRCIHLLPSKDRNKKTMVLQILVSALQIIKEWEDELLPLVHQIWQPLVQRFKEFNDPLIQLYSFKLLITLARLSEDFIRMRTIKEVLPTILEILQKYSNQSYLKDKGAAYRYSQGFKLQLEILEKLGEVLVCIEADTNIIEMCMETVFRYLNSNQPIPLQVSAFNFFMVLAKYDDDCVNNKVNNWLNIHQNAEMEVNIRRLQENLKVIVDT